MNTYRLRLNQKQTLHDCLTTDVEGETLEEAISKLEAAFDEWNMNGEAFVHPDTGEDFGYELDPQEILTTDTYVVQVDANGREIPKPPPPKPDLPLGLYQHWKGTLFNVVAVAKEAATGEWWVVHSNARTQEALTIRYSEWSEPRDGGEPRFRRMD